LGLIFTIKELKERGQEGMLNDLIKAADERLTGARGDNV
tara:strand:- start:185 stop:301 length:117 start_codon:yes stop_codon:yes gene_type:complete